MFAIKGPIHLNLHTTWRKTKFIHFLKMFQSDMFILSAMQFASYCLLKYSSGKIEIYVKSRAHRGVVLKINNNTLNQGLQRGSY